MFLADIALLDSQSAGIFFMDSSIRLKDKAEGSTRLTYTGLRGGLEHLKIETRFIDERFASVMGECVI